MSAVILFNFGLLVLIWLVQLIIYPSFRHIGESEFVDWHARYTTRISFVVIPLMFGQVGFLGYSFWISGPDAVLIAQSVLVFFAWLVTFLVSVPCHNALAVKKDDFQIKRLITTNWFRTIAWTMVSILDLV